VQIPEFLSWLLTLAIQRLEPRAAKSCEVASVLCACAALRSQGFGHPGVQRFAQELAPRVVEVLPTCGHRDVRTTLSIACMPHGLYRPTLMHAPLKLSAFTGCRAAFLYPGTQSCIQAQATAKGACRSPASSGHMRACQQRPSLSRPSSMLQTITCLPSPACHRRHSDCCRSF
jgi:hypothetical protein